MTFLPQCYACGGESNLHQRSKGLLEFWCFPCIDYHVNDCIHNMGFAPRWMLEIVREDAMKAVRQLHWTQRLRNWIHGEIISSRAIAMPLVVPGSIDATLAKWHTARYKLMYEREVAGRVRIAPCLHAKPGIACKAEFQKLPGDAYVVSRRGKLQIIGIGSVGLTVAK